MVIIPKILIANRGEIVVRIASTASKLGIRTVGIYSDADKNSGYFQYCNTAYKLDGSSIRETYLNIDQIIHIAGKSECAAIHPGYGFLSENPAFAKACADHNLIFIGPEANILELMGNKLRAKKIVKDMGVVVIEGIKGHKDDLVERTDQLDFPVLIKAASGGGGKGLRIVKHKQEFSEQLENAGREAEAYFGDNTLYVEQFLNEPRHIEVQLLGDNFGKVIHLYHRECSLQRRFQKIIEEAPAAGISKEMSGKMLESAVSIARQIGYSGAGTIEFLVDRHDRYYFLEMNTRIQVEHPVTEMITGIDIVEQQIQIASGTALTLNQEDIRINGHAVESRLYAENTADHFKPSPGKILYFNAPDKSLARTDTWISSGTVILPDYDSMLAKIITHRTSRSKALTAHLAALGELKILGIETNLLFLKEIIRNKNVRDNKISTTFIENNLPELISYTLQKEEKLHTALAAGILCLLTPQKNVNNLWEEIGYWRKLNVLDLTCDGIKYRIDYLRKTDTLHITVDRKKYQFKIISIRENRIILERNKMEINIAYAHDNEIIYIGIDSHQFLIKDEPEIVVPIDFADQKTSLHNSKIVSPIPGIVSKIYVKKNQAVTENQNLFIVEAMKMDNYIASDCDGIVEKVNVKVGQHISANQVLLDFKKPHEATS